MPGLSLKTLLSPRYGSGPAITALRQAADNQLAILDPGGNFLVGDTSIGERIPIELESATLGYVTGPPVAANALALLLTHLAARETESRSLTAEILHLYREANLIEQLSEQLAALLDVDAVSQCALEQAQRILPSTHGSMLVMHSAAGPLRQTALFAPSGTEVRPLTASSPLAASILERGTAEIINDTSSDPRTQASEHGLGALIAAPLRSGQRTVGLIALANTAAGASYSAANLKLLNTIALQTATAIVNALLSAEMVAAAGQSAVFAAELRAASTVQQMLLQSASQPTPGFKVDSVYLPASEVGGDFFFVNPAPDGSLLAIVGDVAGKGLTAAMRVAMILGALRRETSHDPAEILTRLNDALSIDDQLGFTTACCVRLWLSGEFALANAGHIAPYLSGEEIVTPPALPLGLVPNQAYDLVRGRVRPNDRLVLMSDGVPEARAATGELYGFDRLAQLTLTPARTIAEAAQQYGQEDDITVLTLAITAP